MKKLIPEKLYQKIVNVIPVCCVDLVIKKNNQFLLVKRLEDPARSKWWFPGGRVLFNESLKNAVKRKLREELNIRKADLIRRTQDDQQAKQCDDQAGHQQPAIHQQRQCRPERRMAGQEHCREDEEGQG